MSALITVIFSFSSGALAQGMDARSAFERLVERLKPLLDRAAAQGVRIGFEPEPGMLIETVADYHRLHRALHAHAALGLSLDCGHLLVTGEDPPQLVLAREQEHLVAIAIEDMRVGIHEHLPFGAGDVDLPALTAALKDLPFEGVVAVELGRHAHDGPREAARARRSLEPLGVPFAPWRAPWPLESA